MIRKFFVIAEGEGRLDIVSRISMLVLQRHVDVESLKYLPMDGCRSRYEVCALSHENSIRQILGQMEHIEGLDKIIVENEHE